MQRSRARPRAPSNCPSALLPCSRPKRGALLPPPPSTRREAELRQIRKATLLSTVNNLVFGGGPILISLGGALGRGLVAKGPSRGPEAARLAAACSLALWRATTQATLRQPAAMAPAWSDFQFTALPTCAAFLTYSACGYPLTASVAFPALALFNLLRFPVMMFPAQVRRAGAGGLGPSCQAGG